jgi:DNA-binding MurR/RpiR family transcriptional regulator
VARKVLQSDAQAILDTLAVLNPVALERAVTALLGATRIECYGIASSAPIALDAYYRFLRIDLPATVVADPHVQAVSAARLPPGSVAFAVSHTGRTEETLNAVRKAKESRACCVVLTSHARTPLGALADVELVTAARETAFRTEAAASRIAHLSVVDALYVACAMRRFDASLEALDQANAIIAERRVM